MLDTFLHFIYNAHVMLEESLEISMLYDFYGPLLTERQQSFVELYFNENLSLNEIAADAGVSKQAVSEALKKAEKSLRNYEDKLGLVARWKRENNVLEAGK